MATPRRKALVCLLPYVYALGIGGIVIARIDPDWVADPLALSATLLIGTMVAAMSEWISKSRLLVRRDLRWLGVGSVMLSCAAAGITFSPTVRLWHFLVVTLLAIAGHLAKRSWIRSAHNTRSLWAEGFRRATLGAVTLAILHPYLISSLVGGGDAHDYAQHLADFIEQWRAGIVPVFVGQSDYAFNGDIHPLRTAPGFFYAGGILDLLTVKQLSPVALQNLLIVLSGVAGAFTAYLSLIKIAPRHAWICWLLSLLFISSPGVLALLFSGDMIASWLTLPWLPLLLLALTRMVDRPEESRWPIQAAITFAAIWLFHPPIGFWVSVCALPFAIRHLTLLGATSRSFLCSVSAIGVFLLLSLYVFISAATLDIPADPNLRLSVEQGALKTSSVQTWLGFLHPVSKHATELLSDLQLSPGLWLALLIGLLGYSQARQSSTRLLLWIPALLLFLLCPLSEPVWRRMPDIVLSMTEKWPAQRFFVILSATIPFLALPTLVAIGRRHRKLAIDILILLILAGGWSMIETVKFVRRGYAITLPLELTQKKFLSGNTALSRYSHEYYGRLPRYFVNGPGDAQSMSRILDRDTLEPISFNSRFLLRTARDTGTKLNFESTSFGGKFAPRLKIGAGQRYLLRFDFKEAELKGALQVQGKNVQVEYSLPNAGEERAFSSAIGRRHYFTIWNSGENDDIVEIKFIRAPDYAAVIPAIEVECLPYANARLPIALHGLLPYTATIRSPRPGWLETPKLFIAGYTATVNGDAVKTYRSPDGLVMVPVPTGESQIVISYPGPLILRISFWITAAAWAGCGLYFILRRHLAWTPEKAEDILVGLGRLTAIGCIAILLGLLLLATERRSAAQPKLDGDMLSLETLFAVGEPPGATAIIQTLPGNSKLLVRYIDGKRVRLGYAPERQPPVLSAPVPVNYLAKQHITLIKKTSWLEIRLNERLVLVVPNTPPAAVSAQTASAL